MRVLTDPYEVDQYFHAGLLYYRTIRPDSFEMSPWYPDDHIRNVTPSMVMRESWGSGVEFGVDVEE